MKTTYQQFCLQQMGIPIWQRAVPETVLPLTAAIYNAQNQVVGWLVLGEPAADDEVSNLIVAMLQAIKCKPAALARQELPRDSKGHFLLMMGEASLPSSVQEQYQKTYCIVHPAEMIKDASLKRAAWNTLKEIVA